MSSRRSSGAVLAAALLLPLLALGLGPAASADDASGSAVTLAGRGPFADLRLTVSKTRALRNEVVQVSWSGVRPTRGNFAVDYLQVFQCWGDDPDGPDREQCQYGGLTGDSRGGAQVASRQVTYGIRDPRETLLPQAPGQLRYVPFRSVTGKTSESGLSEFFDATTTNELPFARTRSDGGGTVPFEVQTAVEAPGLGCGAPLASTPARPARSAVKAAATASPTATATALAAPAVAARPPSSGGRSCWLVVVPRGDVEVDGSTRSDDSTNQLLSSPLSQSNWDQRLVVPLDFAPLGQPCPIGTAERSVVGHEQAVEAVGSWQPALCARSGPVYSYSQVSDGVARRQVVSDEAVLGLTTAPLESEPDGRPAVYAPVALSGIAVAFDIESQSRFDAPADVAARDGQQITALDLTPRLLAKLLTQSYKLGAATQDRPGLEKNALDLTRDPDFLRVNPSFRALRFIGIGDVLVPAGLSDAGGAVWRWILADPEAAAFLAGTPDPDGMVVNPAYRGTAQQDGFPKADQVCRTFATDQPPLCTLDAHPYAGDTHEAARAAARGDTLSRSTYDATALPPVYRKSVPQPTGQRAVLALTDTATAARYGLPTARLRNSSGAFVAADAPGLLAGLAAMRPAPAAPPVLQPDPATRDADAYPLTSLTYAVGTPSAMTAAARADYAALLRYAAGAGQRPGPAPGQLPPGYAPLPEAQRGQTLAAAARLAAETVPARPAPGASAAASTPPAPDGAPAAPVPGALFPGGRGDTAPPADLAPAAAGLPPELQPDPPAAVAVPSAPAPPVALALSRPTAAERLGAGRYSVPLVLAGGLLAAAAGRLLRRRARPAPAVPSH